MQAFFIKQLKGEKSFSPCLTRMSEDHFRSAKTAFATELDATAVGHRIQSHGAISPFGRISLPQAIQLLILLIDTGSRLPCVNKNKPHDVTCGSASFSVGLGAGSSVRVQPGQQIAHPEVCKNDEKECRDCKIRRPAASPSVSYSRMQESGVG